MSIAASLSPAVSTHVRWRDVAAAALFLGALAGLSWRLYEHRPLAGRTADDEWTLASFRDTVYYPTRAVIDGVNPYDSSRAPDPRLYLNRYPVADHFPLYSPLILLIFAPLSLLPPDTSLLGCAALNALLFVVLAWVTLRVIGWRLTYSSVFGLATLLLISQPGRGAFNSGQVALLLALASLGALHFGDCRPQG